MLFLFIAVLLKILMVLSLGTSHKSYSHLCYSWTFGTLPTVLSAFESVTREKRDKFLTQAARIHKHKHKTWEVKIAS